MGYKGQPAPVTGPPPGGYLHDPPVTVVMTDATGFTIGTEGLMSPCLR